MNFVFINPDQMRAESLGCYGHPLTQTPNLDRLASEGTRFEQCHVQHTVCTPSRCSLQTGWYPHVHGHRTLWNLLKPHEPSLFKYLKQEGYRTHWVGKNDTFTPGHVEQALDYMGGRISHCPTRNPYKQDDPRFYSFLFTPCEGDEEGHGDMRTAMAGVEFLESNPKEPFALNLNLGYPHPPYTAPPRWHDMYDPAEVPALRPADLPNRPDYHALIRKYRRLDDCPEEFLRKINAVYLGMISFSDFIIGRVLDALRETGLDRNTTVFFYSDHGDYSGDFGLVEKWTAGLEDVLTRVPMIIKTPGGAEGHVVSEPTEVFDVMATALELADIEPQHTHFSSSQVEQLHGGYGDAERAIFAEGGYGLNEPHCPENDRGSSAGMLEHTENPYYPKIKQQVDHPESVERCNMIRTIDHKLVYRPSGQSELYDLSGDPREINNRYDDSNINDVRTSLEQRLLRWLTETSDVTPFEEDSRNRPTFCEKI